MKVESIENIKEEQMKIIQFSTTVGIWVFYLSIKRIVHNAAPTVGFV